MGNLAKIGKDWTLLCTDALFETPTDHPVVCMDHKQTKERAYFDIKLDSLFSQHEAFDVLNGNHWSFVAKLI